MLKPEYEKLIVPKALELVPINKNQADFIYEFLIKKKLSRTLEIGFGFGFSAVFIASATKQKHVVIDHTTDYLNFALDNIRNCGLEELILLLQEPSHSALPELLRNKSIFDFALIDGGHKFDEIFIDFYYIDLMLDDGGYIIFDDTWMKSTRHVISWIKTNKENYHLIKDIPGNYSVYQKRGTEVRNWNHFEEFTLQPNHKNKHLNKLKKAAKKILNPYRNLNR
jgi:predicted O-methyltransferase YrrM